MSKTITAQNELDTSVVRGAFINPCECGSFRLVAQEEVHVEAQGPLRIVKQDGSYVETLVPLRIVAQEEVHVEALGPIRVVTQDGTHVGANEMVAYLRIHGFCPYRSTT